jgi:low density lipoprotein receptor adapter protein 1
VQDAKFRGGKLQKVQVTVSSKFVRLVDVQLQMKLDELPLYRVSYCTVDPYYDKVFCYISRNAETKGLECHAFLCSKKSKVYTNMQVIGRPEQ